MFSIIIPFYNEAENLPILLSELKKNLHQLEHEIIFVDDGSIDGGDDRLKKAGATVLSHRKRLGKGAALATGFKKSKGETIIFMDADLQDNPDDIKKFLDAIDEGYDVVNGWRKDRQDKIDKTLPSRLANAFLWKALFHSTIHDMNCGFKAIRKEVLQEIPLYGDNYRFLPLIAHNKGFSVGEVVVSHRPRRFGKSKYNAMRLFFGLFDTLTTYFIFRFSEKPLHFFGTVGGGLFGTGFILALYLTIDRVVYGHLLYRRPALLLSILLIIVGIQIVMTGIVAELVVHLDKKAKNR